VAVAPEHRGTGLGIRLTKAALDLAASRRVPAVYLLTETAGGFFPRFGFRPIPRSAVPAGVLGSVEFTSACPASALVMKLALP
jgi:amino-acid N-acetyltransferase